MAELKPYPFEHFNLNAPEMQIEDVTLTIREKIYAECLNMQEAAILEAVIRAAKEAGVTELFLLDKQFVVDALTAALEKRRAEIKWEEKTKEAFGSIASYNRHEEWLWNMADEMANCDSFYSCDLPTEEWYTDKHALWMFLVGLFGDWGTSIRCGWIEDKEAAIAFINSATERFSDEMDGEPNG